ncbi:hypothetical protein EGW08_011985, partial [Elysia chlorotica]
QTNLQSESDCDLCPGGYYCETDGLTEPTGICEPGYFCPEGSVYKDALGNECPIGHFCPGGNAAALPCRNNSHVNHTHATSCYDCPAGYYCELAGQSILCPAGYFCPAGTGLDWQACPRGTFSSVLGLYDQSQCLPCSAGKYCGGEHLTAETGDCAAGHWCLSGVDRLYPGGDNLTTPLNNSCYDDRLVGQGGVCPTGHYCPGGVTSYLPVPCGNGTYADEEGLSACKTCQQGYYCPVGTANFTDNQCPSGYYCPTGTGWMYDYPCPAGTFNNLTLRISSSDCLSCTGGQYCGQDGLSSPSGLCEAGFYCSGGSSVAMPSGAGGDQCSPGYYCPEGSSQPIECDPGQYCATARLNTTSGDCQQGYYCSRLAIIANPTDGNVTGDICPEGAYCPAGSGAPTLCPPSTYLNSTGNWDLAHCLTCTAGSYCDGSGNSVPDGLCDPGYYCPGGQNGPNLPEYNCTLGHYCPEGSTSPIRCPSGSYQDELNQWSCKSCPQGFYCDNTMSPVVLYNSSFCPEGFYCPENTTHAVQYPCPAGTFNNLTHQTSIANCQQCSGGYYCDQDGLASPAGLCSTGYYCTSGANSSTPLEGDDANICPAGFYCPEGSAVPVSCPLGTYNPFTGRGNVSECTACSGGRYCPYYNMTQPGPQCEEGYYCPSGADVSNYLLCPAGSYCPEESTTPTQCPAGTFSNATGLGQIDQCTNCTGGFYCPSPGMTAATDLCWGGFYCPEGVAVPNPLVYVCPQGLHCPNGSQIYQECAAGSYTSVSGQWECDPCPAGAYCLPVQPDNSSLATQDCPAGYYCPQGTGADWSFCPSGTFSNQTGLSDISQCTPCSAGKFCQGQHLTQVSGDCDTGFYCTSGVDRPRPGASNDTTLTTNCSCPSNTFYTGVGGPCPLGHYCPAGSDLPVPCAAGTYADEELLGACKLCPAGYFCLTNSSEFLSSVCPQGHYCPNGTEYGTEFRCPPGTYNPSTLGTSQDDCLSCPGGQYCQGYANVQPTGNCTEGWYCTGGSDSPNSTTAGGQCQPGYYCPEGSSDPIPCPGGQYCLTTELAAPTGNCSAGYYCSLRAVTQTPTDGATGDRCPAGHYCEEGVASPVPCSPGTYSPSVGNTQPSDCLPCTFGEYCGDYNLTATSGNCSQGYYCPQGDITPTSFQCTVGHYCPEHTSTPILCPSGFFQDEIGQWDCKLCPEGYFCDSSTGVVVVNDTIKCQEGYFCPEGTSRTDQYPCPIGTFSNSSGLNASSDCTPCSAGQFCGSAGLTAPTGPCSQGYFCKWYAEMFTPNQTADAEICPQGSYCPEGSASPTACPSGTYGSTTGLTNVTECTACWPGFYCQTPGLTAVEGLCNATYFCVEGSDSPSSEICPSGHYCPQGTAVPERCPEGTFNPYTGLASVSECTSCTPGQYCETEGLSMTTGPCEAGFYCPSGQNSSRPDLYPCPVAHFCPLNSSLPEPCGNGTYMNHTMAEECDICPDGWYCLQGELVSECPAGYYCPSGTGQDWTMCPRGTFNNQTGLSSSTQCSPCTGGYYCDREGLTSPTGPCAEGYYCEYGVDRSQPSGADNATYVNGSCQLPGGESGVGGICPLSHYCPTGSAHPIPCSAGSFANVTGLPVCHLCPEGFYCLNGVDSYLDSPCPSGHYCPAGTSTPYQNPCPRGTYYNLTQARDVMDCLPCPGGEYCETDGLSFPTGSCQAGWFCTSNSSSATPSSPEGGQCVAGQYCPEGSSAPTSCDPGTFCQTDGLAAPTGNCSAGYYCILGAYTSTPTDGTTGDICPTGHYCPESSGVVSPCPMGYYLDAVQQVDLSDCKLCPAGQYCPTSGANASAGDCDQGYYCPGGQNSSTPHEYNCPVGHYCMTGVDAPARCANGTHQPLETQAQCDPCPAGYFCDNTMSIVLLDNSTTVCPMGSYCPQGTRFANEFLCPIGTFNNITGLQTEADCTPCLGGYYCPLPGMVTPIDLCDSGYFCKQHANISAPDQGDDANICPIGHFCPVGTSAPLPCPKGTFNNGTGLESESACILCTPGSYCDATGLTDVSGPCSEGFYCELGSNTSQPTICPVGHYCPEGSSTPSPCPQGTYTNTQGLLNSTQCTECDPGMYCNDTSLSSPVGECDPGFYCPGGAAVSSPVSTPCPIGLHCPLGSELPKPCPAGTYANFSQASECLICPDGYYCVPEEVIQGNSSSGHRLCPRGFYCGAGSGLNYSACPVGTFSNELGLREVSECQACLGGYYCDRTNLTAPAGECDPGYYCTLGVDVSAPAGSHSGEGGVCPPGFYCPGRTVTPEGCSAGTFQDQHGQPDCEPCPAGYFCTSNSSMYTDKVCPSGHYCPEGTASDTQYPCPAGTFNNLTGQHNTSGCEACSPGQYCGSPGQSSPTGDCDPGWYCTLGSSLPTPTSPEGGKCLAGTYCPQGSASPVGCTPGQYCDTDMMSSPAGPCLAGYYCDGNSTTDRPSGSGGDQCPSGHYCVEGSSSPAPCNPGYFQPSNGAQNVTWCVLCTSGKFCNSSGLSAPDGYCDEGYYCPEGQTVRNPSPYLCSPGHYCTVGSSIEAVCPSGQYQDLDGEASCKTCPQGYYCDNAGGGVTTPASYVCPEGHYCPNGTRYSTEFPCPAGSFNNITGLEADTDCFACLGGYYCPGGTTYPSLPCSAGYFCRTGAQTAAPSQGLGADICPVGYYCPEMTTEPIACPVGTFSNSTGLRNETDCIACTQGSYCDSLGQVAPTGLCSPGFYCIEGSTSSAPTVCPAGRYCPEGTHTPNRCPASTFSNATRLEAVDNCTQCTAGYYCQNTGLTAEEGLCQEGYYCPTGSSIPTQVVCPIALHCPTGSDEPRSCLPGYYTNRTNSATCDICLDGFYCPSRNISTPDDVPGYFDCPAGYYCANGTALDWSPCPKGTYSNQTNLYKITQCKDCDGGYHCSLEGATEPTGLCDVGYYCQSGVDRPNPDNAATNSSYPATCPLLGGHTGFGDICPRGYYCPQGSEQPIGCAAGSYQDQEGQGLCKNCPAGFYCPDNSTDFSDKPCPSGYYCPESTQFSVQFPCASGTFNNATGQTNVSACVACTGGSYCASSGLFEPSGLCSPGWYCYEGSTQAMPTDPSMGGKCTYGQYCPEGSSNFTLCDGGTYCSQAGLSAPSGNCSQGYYCLLGAILPTPSDSTGNGCPRGHYCPEGSTYGTPCPIGYYLDTQRNSRLTNCKICTPGQYCGADGLETPDGACDPGYYCPAGSTSATPANTTCSEGHFCVGGQSAPETCPSGYYQKLPGQAQCDQCPAGFYCNATFGPVVTYDPYVCPEGFFCPNGTQYAEEHPCPVSTFNNITGLTNELDCQECVGGMACDQVGLTYPLRPCSPGYYCRNSAMTTTPTQGANADECPAGSYCPEQTAEPIPCPQGTYSPAFRLTQESECLNCTAGFFCNETGLTSVAGPCEAGFYCPLGSVQQTEVLCPEGHYCPAQAVSPTGCPNGTFSNTTGLAQASECTPCMPGYYCSGPGLVEVSGPCREGYYCPSGSAMDTQIICPSAKHCPTGSSEPHDCPAGYYVDYDGSPVCLICPEGYYCIPSLSVAGDPSSAKHLCPEGFFCPNGTGHDWQACPAGTFSSATGLRSADECTPCLAGDFCQGVNLTSTSGPCDPGYYCVSGVDKANPVMLNDTQCPNDTVHPIIGHICPAGHFCPGGTDFPIACPAGSFQDLTNQAGCKDCPEGYFCPSNTSDYTPNVCPAGYYCEVNTTDQFSLPCPAGTFNPVTQRVSVAECQPCTPGTYCQGVGNAAPTGNCSAGWYCINGSSQAQTTINGGECQPGFFCPEGSDAMQECTPGSYCQTAGLDAPTGLCDAGYYCPLGSSSVTQVVCPVGHYCEQGSNNPDPCRNGTYAPITGLQSDTECYQCDGGFYCNGTGLSAVSGECDQGFYCPGGQSVPNPYDYLCPVGHYCLANSATPTRCVNGEYQNELGKWTCKDCPQGYFCDNSVAAVGSLANQACPEGYYCPLRTEYYNQYPCPSGTFNNKTHRTEEADCQLCLPGFYCQSTGLAEPEGPCYPGYYCVGNNTSPIPAETICPVGNYCPEGSYQPTPCPQGTLASSLGNSNASDCELCNPGRYCTPNSSMSGVSLPCDAGFICLTGSSLANPTDNVMGYICPYGHYCLTGAVVETPCDKGTYGPSTGLSTCDVCPEGQTCPSQAMNASLPCPAGYYCESGTDNDGTPCPLGTWSNQEALSRPEDCLPCPAGQFCNETGLTGPSGSCYAGYLCVANATTAAPDDGVNGPCPPGYYCELGTLAASKCPRGTQRNATHGASVSDCWPCDPGHYCDTTGLLGPSGVCQERYYCPDSASIETAAPSSYACPAGFYCPQETGVPIGCPPGTYQPNLGEIACLNCPSGYYCVQNTSLPEPCPPYSFCPNGTSDPILCPNGTYTDALTTGLEAEEDCWSCVAGKYCVGGQIAGDCAAGYLCKYGNDVPNPGNGTGDNGLCPYGYYCQAGATSPQICPALSFIDKIGAGDISECQPCPGGRICPQNSTLSIPCYPGYYCKVSEPIAPCPIRTYNELEGADDESWCLPCPPGYICDQEGTSNYTLNPCPPGSYCLNATSSATVCPPGTFRGEVGAASLADCTLCPAGFYCPTSNMTYGGIQCDQGMACPAGSQNQTICSAGYYCNMSMGQTPCPPGYYCPEMSSFPILCPVGHYCGAIDDCNCNATDAGAIEPRQCPLGYKEYSGSLRRTFEETCEPCPPGYYGAHPNRTVCTPCRAGVVCKIGATTDDPVSNSSSVAAQLGYATTNSYLCPPGYYCPQASFEATECPAGRYNPSEGASSLSDCIECPVDTHNPYSAQVGCFQCGGQASQPDTGATTCICNGAGRDYQFSDRTCPCKAGYVQVTNTDSQSLDCSKKVYPRCGSGTYRTQDGRCFDDAQWQTHCTQEVCEVYVGFDRNLGLCLCQTDDLEEICDLECRLAQQWQLTLTCSSAPLVPHVTVRDSNNNTIVVINSRNSITEDQCEELDDSVSYVHLVEMSSKGFLGVYNPDATQVMRVCGSFIFPLILKLLFFNNLYNTNSNFDYGGFRALIEAQAQAATSATLFAYKFTDPGVYSFYLSTDINKKMVRKSCCEATRNEEPYIPYVPYPTNPKTGQRVDTRLRPMTNSSEFRWGLPMSDPSLGLHVPILAMTTGSVIPVGGVHVDPVTGLPVPIELGSMMADPNSGQAVPILAVTLDPETGMVVPIGGTKESDSTTAHIPIVPGDEFVDPTSRRSVRVYSGLVPITIGRKAVDPVSGELSPVIGIRRSTDTKMAVPVTLASGAHRKPRPPPGAKCLDDLDTLVQQLSESARGECQRRGAATAEISASGLLPPHISRILTAGDKVEAERDEAHIAMHSRFSELLKTRVETLDEGHSSLEYAREFSELCAKEAKIVLTRSALLAGDYDAQLTGVYGDLTDAAGQDSDLVPLLRQLIAMLEAGGPFYLSPELLNFINNGGSSSSTTNNITNQDWVNLLMMSPLFRQINDLEDLLAKADTSTTEGSAVGSGPPGMVYGSKNAFRNSIFYEHAKKILFIRRERMDSIGEFVMVIVHSLAHIKSGDLTDDSHPLFMREFYRALRVVCQDMFFSRSRNTPASQGLMMSAAPGQGQGLASQDSRPALERALTGVRSMDDRTNVVSELLDVKTNLAEFTSQKMSQRLYGYESLASNARLRQQLAARGGYSTSGDFIASRMAELKGQKSPLANTTRSPIKRMRPAQIISSPRELLGSQIVSLRAKSDDLNEELSKVLKAESDLRAGMSSLAEDSDKLTSLREKLTTTLVRKEELLRSVTVLEDEIAQKEKTVKKRK